MSIKYTLVASVSPTHHQSLTEMGLPGSCLCILSRQCHSFKYYSYRKDSKIYFLKSKFTLKFYTHISSDLLGCSIECLASISNCAPHTIHLFCPLLPTKDNLVPWSLMLRGSHSRVQESRGTLGHTFLEHQFYSMMNKIQYYSSPEIFAGLPSPPL